MWWSSSLSVLLLRVGCRGAVLHVRLGNHTGDRLGSLDRRLVRPESQRRPAVGLEPCVRIRVTLTIGLDLLPPEVRVPLRPCGVLGAAMPEAAIDEDGDLAAGESDIGDAARLSQNLVAEPVAQTDAVHLPTERRCGVRARLPHLHHAATGIG